MDSVPDQWKEAASRRIIVALDEMNREEALRMAELFRFRGVTFKVNTLLRQCGHKLIEELRQYGNVFADSKLHDIRNTVKNDIEALEKLSQQPRFVTMMAAGGIDTMRTAAHILRKNKSKMSVLAVTVLTSLEEEEVQSLHGCSVKAVVLRLARNAALAGVSGIVCSPQELEMLAKFPELHDLLRVTPGIRPAWHQTGDDQRRTMTPAEAIKLGADCLVIGRPITKAKDPVEALERTVEEVARALQEKAATAAQ